MKTISMGFKSQWHFARLSVFVVIFLFASCQQSKNTAEARLVETPSGKVSEAANEPASEEKSATVPSKIETLERKIIKTGEIRFRTADLNKTHQAIAQAVQSLKGYISEENQSGYHLASEMRLIVRIPAQGFDSLMHIIATYAIDFDSKNIHSQDVTEEFIDVAARLKTKKELENQYSILLKKAQTIKEIMEVERELNNVRTEIESAEGRLRYLSSQVAFSTLNITFYKEKKAGRNFWSRLGDGFLDGWNLLLDFLIGLISIWTFLLIFGGAFWIIRRVRLARKVKSARSDFNPQ